VAEAADFPQTTPLVTDLKSQVVVIDLHIARAAEPSVVRELLATSKVSAISLSNDEAKQLEQH
jgi:hypothetical protein